MATNKYIIQLVVETGDGTARVKGVSKAFQDLDNQVKITKTNIDKTNASLKNTGGAAGIAGAAALELGRTVSDLPYGISAVTNNISQLGNMFAMLVLSSGGLRAALINLHAALVGPIGILLAFQAVVAGIEFYAQSLRKSKTETEKQKDELKELSKTLEEQAFMFNALAKNAFNYSSDITKIFAKNMKEVSSFLEELRKEGPITEEQYTYAVQLGNDVLQARIKQNQELIKINEARQKLIDLGGEEALTEEKLRVVAVETGKTIGQVTRERTKARQDLTSAVSTYSFAVDDESNALKILNYTATEEVVVEEKVKKAKEETIKTRYGNINAMIREALSSVSSFRNAYIDRRVFQQREKLDDIEFLEWKADFFNRLSKDSSFSYEEQTRFYAQYVASTEQLGDLQLRNEMIKLNAMENINMSYADSLGTIFDTIAGLAGENRFLQAVALIGESAVGIAKIIISTKAANMAARLKYALIPGGQALAAAEIAANNFGAKVGIGANIAATATALSELKAPASAPSSPSIGSDNSAGLPNELAPAFNVVGSSTSQLAQILGAQGQQPIKTYVVAGEVSSAQSLERNRVKEASI
jgi:hypothetical protein